MIFSKVLELVKVLKEADEEVGGIVAIDGYGIWEHGLPVIQLAEANALVEIAGMLGEPIDVIERPYKDRPIVYGEMKTDGVAFRRFNLTDAEISAINDFNRAIINERKKEFKKEMQK